MRVEILGTRGNIKPSEPRHRRHSGVLVDDRILLDLGEPEYLERRPEAIFITHLHNDHAAFVDHDLTIQAPLFVPEPAPQQPAAHVVSRATTFAGYRLTPVPTVHSGRLRSQGYVVEGGGVRLFYSADLVSIEKRHWRRLRGLNAVITEGSFMRRGGMVRDGFGHAGIPELVEFFRRFTERIILTHFGSWFYRNVDDATRQIEALGATAAHDGMVVEI